MYASSFLFGLVVSQAAPQSVYEPYYYCLHSRVRLISSAAHKARVGNWNYGESNWRLLQKIKIREANRSKGSVQYTTNRLMIAKAFISYLILKLRSFLNLKS